MAKKETEETRTGVENLNDTLTNIEQKVQNNSKPFIFGLVGIVAIVALVLVYFYAIRQPGIAAANEAIALADAQARQGNDSLALAQYEKVAADFSYDAGNRAKLNAAIILYRNGKYQEALDYLKKYKAQDKVIAASAKSLEGDCYVNLEKYQEALGCYEEAVKLSNDNPAYTPAFMLKEATVYGELKDYAKQAEVYQSIVDKYPSYGPSMNIDVEKYLENAKATK